MSNPNHDSRGRFSSSSAATGDHQASASIPQTPRLAVKAHGGVPSVGTTFRTRAKIKDFPGRQTTRGPGAIARERVALNQATDRRHYPDEAADVQQRFRSRATGMR